MWGAGRGRIAAWYTMRDGGGNEDQVSVGEQAQLLPRKRSGPGRVVSVISGKAGAGKSTVASNLASTIARDHGLAVAVLDLALQFGDQSLMFDAASTPSIVDVLINADALTGEFILECMHQGAGVRIMGAPPSPELADLVTNDHIQAVLAHLKVIFDVVMIDTESHLSDATLAAVDSADALIVLTTPYLASVKNTKLLLKTLSDLGVLSSKLTAVLNRLEPAMKMPLDVLEANLKFPISIELPHASLALIESVTDGVPLALTKPNSEWGQKISSLSNLILADGKADAAPKSGRHGFRRLAR